MFASEVLEPVTEREAIYRPREVAELLSIDESTLRLWSTRFGAFLSEAATRKPTGDGVPAQRRYVEADLAVLRRIDALLRQERLRYDEVNRRLRAELAANPMSSAAPPPASTADAVELADAFREALYAQEQAVVAKDETIAELRRALDRQEDVIWDLRRSRDALEDRAAQLGKQLIEARREQSHLARELRRRQSWWRRLFTPD